MQPPGKIWVADHNGVYVIKMEGDVRLTLCVSFDQFIEDMFSRDDFCSIVFDLTNAELVDSTTLGLMAKISIRADKYKGLKPSILSSSKSMRRLLESMGFEEIFDIIDSEATAQDGDTCECECVGSEDETRKKVLEAHKALMSLNEKNKETFQDLVKSLENT